MKKIILLLSTTVLVSSLLIGCTKEEGNYTQSKKERDYIENKREVESKPFTEKEKQKIREVLEKEQNNSDKVSKDEKEGDTDIPELQKSDFIDDKTFKLYSDYTLFGKDDTILKDVSPEDIFKLYFHSVNVEDLGTQYYLLYKDDKIVNYLEFTNKYAKQNRSSEESIVEYLKNGAEINVTVEGDKAQVLVTGGGIKSAFFEMRQNDKGVWKLYLLDYYKI